MQNIVRQIFFPQNSDIGTIFSRILRLAKLLSLFRLLRLSRLVRYVGQWEEVIVSHFIFNLFAMQLFVPLVVCLPLATILEERTSTRDRKLLAQFILAPLCKPSG